MELRCIICGSYYPVNEREEQDLLRGLPVCSAKCLSDLREQNMKQNVINNIDEEQEAN